MKITRFDNWCNVLEQKVGRLLLIIFIANLIFQDVVENNAENGGTIILVNILFLFSIYNFYTRIFLSHFILPAILHY